VFFDPSSPPSSPAATAGFWPGVSESVALINLAVGLVTYSGVSVSQPITTINLLPGVCSFSGVSVNIINILTRDITIGRVTCTGVRVSQPVEVKASRGGGGYYLDSKGRRDRNRLRIRHVYGNYEIQRPIVPILETPTGTAEGKDVFTVSVSSRAEELRQRLLTQVLKARKVNSIEDLQSIDDEEEVLVLVSMAMVKLQEMGRI